jgi:formylglycine-generating enzyme required for sulfatase activity
VTPIVSWLSLVGAMGWLAALGPPPASCPHDMVLVVGTHHENVQRICHDLRKTKCWGFAPGLVLLEPRSTPIATCMDRHEWPNVAGQRPEVMLKFTEAEAACAGVGKRLCSEFEWELACEGPAHLPWPYGWSQAAGRCNSDRAYRAYDPKKLESPDAAVRRREVERLWQGAPSGSFPDCASPFGVMDLVGNVEEWVTTSRPEWPHRSSLKGGFWAKPWAGCRGTNDSHAPEFRFYEIGFRCCRDPVVSEGP